MNCIIKEISKEYVEEHFSYLIKPTFQYFCIVKNKKYIGLCLIDKINDKICEPHIIIFNEFRFKSLNRELLEAFFNFPFSLGYEEIWGTNVRGWEKIFKRFNIELQVKKPWWNKDSTNVWFMKRRQ